MSDTGLSWVPKGPSQVIARFPGKRCLKIIGGDAGVIDAQALLFKIAEVFADLFAEYQADQGDSRQPLVPFQPFTALNLRSQVRFYILKRLPEGRLSHYIETFLGEIYLGPDVAVEENLLDGFGCGCGLTAATGSYKQHDRCLRYFRIGGVLFSYMGPVNLLEKIGQFLWKMNIGELTLKQREHVGVIVVSEFFFEDVVPGFPRYRLPGDFKSLLPVGEDLRIFQDCQIAFTGRYGKPAKKTAQSSKNPSVRFVLVEAGPHEFFGFIGPGRNNCI